MKDTKKPEVFLACSTCRRAGSGQRKERDIKVSFITGCFNMEHKLLATDIKPSATKAALCRDRVILGHVWSRGNESLFESFLTVILQAASSLLCWVRVFLFE